MGLVEVSASVLPDHEPVTLDSCAGPSALTDPRLLGLLLAEPAATVRTVTGPDVEASRSAMRSRFMGRGCRKGAVRDVHTAPSPGVGESLQRSFPSPPALAPADGRHHAPQRRAHTHHGEQAGVGKKQDPSSESGLQHGGLLAVTVRSTIRQFN